MSKHPDLYSPTPTPMAPEFSRATVRDADLGHLSQCYRDNQFQIALQELQAHRNKMREIAQHIAMLGTMSDNARDVSAELAAKLEGKSDADE